MSIIRCDHCSRLIDSDYDLECVVEVGDKPEEIVLCESCRERYLAEVEACAAPGRPSN